MEAYCLTIIDYNNVGNSQFKLFKKKNVAEFVVVSLQLW